MTRESIRAEPVRPRSTVDGRPAMAGALASEPVAAATAPRGLTLRALDGFRLSRAVWLAARLGVADAIADGPLTVSEIARATGAHAGSLGRLLNALAAAGVFRRERDGRFAHTAASEPLRSDHPRSQRAWLELALGGEHFEAWGAMEAALRTGRTAFEVRYGATWLDYYRARPDAGRAFAEAMTASTSAFEDALLAADPFGTFELAVDVGGSRGSLLQRLLERNPGARGVLFDVPEVIDRWREDRPASLDGRLTAVGGDFFRAVPAGGDLYLLKFILHDWDDARAAAILRRVRDAVRPGGRAAIVEMVLPDEPVDHPGWLMDLNMLAITGGRERTAAEYRDLLERAGWHPERTVPTGSPLSVCWRTPRRTDQETRCPPVHPPSSPATSSTRCRPRRSRSLAPRSST